ncbi:MAG: molecular chaperone HtpG [Legionellales bacterium]|nr:MAG: molecular chaperone HtpG [Legionellales bacterium]
MATKTATNKAETFGFQAEVKQVLKLVVNSLYSNKEIFIRELISNASDAADKLRFNALSEPTLLEQDPELKIWLSFDKDKRTLTIRDNGIGMTRDDLVSHLGTIAKSGTKEFISSLTGDQSKDSNLIGQFGVGFYSAFIVADKVTVTSRKAGEAKNSATRWTSAGDGEYQLENVTQAARGTEIILHLKKAEDEFLNDWKLRNLVTTYSDHITLPVMMLQEVAEEMEMDAGDENADKDKQAKKTEKKAPEWQTVNRATALWTQAKSEIKPEQYNELYKHISHDFADPLGYSHNKVEGKLEYTSIIYVPAKAPFDLWNAGKAHGLKLYVKRVFIMDDAEQFLPNYLRFVRGIIDTNDLPLNVSREILQSSRTIDNMKTAIVKRVLSMLEKLAKDNQEKYQTFWNEFGSVMKEAPAEDFANKERVAKLLRFASTKDNSDVQNISLEDYVSRMQEKQDKIYYVAAETFNAAKNSPHLEIFRKKGIEVLLLSDRVDEWLMSHLTEFDAKKFQSVARGSLEMEDTKEKTAADKKLDGDFASMLEQIKKDLGDKVKDVRLTKRLTDSPSCIIADDNDMTKQMERIMRSAGQTIPTAKPILELNPEHLMIQRLQTEQDDDKFKSWANILLDQAILSEGGQLDDPANFVKCFNKLLLELAG